MKTTRLASMIIGICATLLSSSALADNNSSWANGGNGTPYLIKYVTVDRGGDASGTWTEVAFLVLNTGATNFAGTIPNCPADPNWHPTTFYIDLTNNAGRQMASLATAAFLSGKNVNVALDNGPGGGCRNWYGNDYRVKLAGLTIGTP